EKELEQLDIAINENDALLKKAEADRDQYEEAIKKIVGEEREKVGSLDMLINQLRHISKEEVYTYDYKYLEDSILNIDSEYKIIVDKYERFPRLVHEQQQLNVSLETSAQAISESMIA